MNNRYMIYFRCWPGFDPDSGFPFQQFNHLPDASILDAVEHYAKEQLATEEGKKALEAYYREQREAQQRQRGYTLPPNPWRPPRRLTEAELDTIKRQREPIEERTGIRLVRSVERLFGWGRSADGFGDRLTTLRQFVMCIEGVDQAKRAARDFQEAFGRMHLEELSNLFYDVNPVFGCCAERDLSRVEKAQLLETAGVDPEAKIHHVEQYCRALVYRTVLNSELMGLIKQEGIRAGQASAGKPASYPTNSDPPQREWGAHHHPGIRAGGPLADYLGAVIAARDALMDAVQDSPAEDTRRCTALKAIDANRLTELHGTALNWAKQLGELAVLSPMIDAVMRGLDGLSSHAVAAELYSGPWAAALSALNGPLNSLIPYLLLQNSGGGVPAKQPEDEMRAELVRMLQDVLARIDSGDSIWDCLASERHIMRLVAALYPDPPVYYPAVQIVCASNGTLDRVDGSDVREVQKLPPWLLKQYPKAEMAVLVRIGEPFKWIGEYPIHVTERNDGPGPSTSRAEVDWTAAMAALRKCCERWIRRLGGPVQAPPKPPDPVNIVVENAKLPVAKIEAGQIAIGQGQGDSQQEPENAPVSEKSHKQRTRIPDRNIVEPKIRDFLNCNPYAKCKEVAGAVGCSVGTVSESKWWKANKKRRADCKKNGKEPIAVPLDDRWVTGAGAGEQTQLHEHRERQAALDEAIDAKDKELSGRIDAYRKSHPSETPEQVAKACNCTAGDVERRQASLDRLTAEQSESEKEDTDQPDPDTKRGMRRKWVNKKV